MFLGITLSTSSHHAYKNYEYFILDEIALLPHFCWSYQYGDGISMNQYQSINHSISLWNVCWREKWNCLNIKGTVSENAFANAFRIPMSSSVLAFLKTKPKHTLIRPSVRFCIQESDHWWWHIRNAFAKALFNTVPLQPFQCLVHLYLNTFISLIIISVSMNINKRMCWYFWFVVLKHYKKYWWMSSGADLEGSFERDQAMTVFRFSLLRGLKTACSSGNT